ncbi:MAG TPA: HU family DNA-binding protein [candidate division Zixibacteria bacterium]|nr:HU family DNA-binding protein [candidate division Zixibacteria bacterium]
MTKDELVARVAKAVGLPKAKVNTVIKSTLDEIASALKKGEKVSFVGFGTFMVAERKERVGRNPRTREEIRIPATVVPKFRPGKTLKEMVKAAKK